jgi:imidazolonepropionase-like amidohydrolase
VTVPQFTTEDLGLLVRRAHDGGLPVTAHAHATRAVEQAIAVGVDGIEHCSCVTAEGFGQVSHETVAALASSGIVVCPTVGLDPAIDEVPPDLLAVLDRMGVSYHQWWQSRLEFVGRLHNAGVRLVSGADSGISPAKRHGILPLSVVDLVTAGLGVSEALSTATSVAAAVCGVGARKGRLAAGYDADLVTVEGDLEKDVTALLRPHSVAIAGTSVLL